MQSTNQKQVAQNTENVFQPKTCVLLNKVGWFLCLMTYQLCSLFNAKAIPLEKQ